MYDDARLDLDPAGPCDSPLDPEIIVIEGSKLINDDGSLEISLEGEIDEPCTDEIEGFDPEEADGAL